MTGRRYLWGVVSVAALLGQTLYNVGDGSPDATIANAFVSAWQRNGFSALVTSPTTQVTKWGTAGLVQTFPTVASSTVLDALIKPDQTDAFNVVQVLTPMFTYYNTVGPNTAGYPTADTAKCPTLVTTTVVGNSCQAQAFSKNYELFAYTSAINGTSNFQTIDPYFTQWNTLGGLSVLGPAIAASGSVTSAYGSVGTAQTFDQGVIVNITSGLYSGKLLGVRGAIYALYAASNGLTGNIGFPTSAELATPDGKIQQTFESGTIQLDPTTGTATFLAPVVSFNLQPPGPVQLNVGGTITATVQLFAADGSQIANRAVAWFTSNGNIAAVVANGLSATITAVGNGTANITVVANGKTSKPLTVNVGSVCCNVGDGAPNTAVRQAFQTAVTRDRLVVQLPAASAATRVGAGYEQELFSTDAVPVRYIVAVPDNSATGYVVTGSLLTAWETLGGAAGALGYPTVDATVGGRQLFQGGALAGNPVQMVSGAILTKWAGLGYETGSAGAPTSAATPFQTFRGTSGLAQIFQNASIVSSTAGALAGQTYAVSGLVLAQYAAAGGPAGNLGAPLDDEHTIGAVRQQDFEGGSVSYAPGASSATVTANPRQPVVSVSPSAVTVGALVHIVVGGFNNNAALRVSQSGAPDFTLKVANGSYSWDVRAPASAAGSTITVTALDTASGGASAQATYSVRTPDATPLTLAIASGDAQTSAPGAALPLPLVVRVTDPNGNPLAGQPVTFAASSGATVATTSSSTDTNGLASATVRLPLSSGVVLATAQAGSQVVSFSARSTATTLPNYPTLPQGPSGTLVAAIASIVRFHQLQNDMLRPNGLADPGTLDAFLSKFCTTDSTGAQLCDGYQTLGSATVPNFWRVAAFVNGTFDARIESSDQNFIRDSIVAGYPVLLAVSGTGGTNFVVATGVAVDGSIVISDTSPAAQTSLNAYLTSGTITGSARFLPQSPPATEFSVVSTIASAVNSVNGACGNSFAIPGAAYLRVCDGSGGPYQLDLNGAYTAILTDLSTGGSRSTLSGASATSFAVQRSAGKWSAGPLTLSFTSASVVNAATFTTDLAPGEIFSIFGTGFARAGAAPAVQIAGKQASVLGSFPFQLNAQVPVDATPGAATLTVVAGGSTVQQPITIKPVAPAIFTLGNGLAAITNPAGALISPAAPAPRGSTIVIYGTGLGATVKSGSLNVASTPTTVVLGGTEIPTVFAGLTPGFVGLYQVNVGIPAALPPGLALPLSVKQGSIVSNAVAVAIQ